MLCFNTCTLITLIEGEIESRAWILPILMRSHDTISEDGEIIRRRYMSERTGKNGHCYLEMVSHMVDWVFTASYSSSSFTVRKRIRIPYGILIQDGDRSVTLQTNFAYFLQ